MKKLLLIFLFPIFLQSGNPFSKLNSEQKSNLDHTFDFYSRAGLTWGISEISYHYTHKKFLSAMIGLGTGVLSSFAERQLYGKLVSVGGSITGTFIFAVRWDIKERRKQQYLEKRRIFET